VKYIAYVDQGNAVADRLRSIGVFSFPASQHSWVLSALATILKTSGVAQLRWEELSNPEHCFCALELLEVTLATCRACDWRVDVLVWDTADTGGHEDGKNLERMFFRLLSSAMEERPCGAGWRVFPEEQLDVDWQVIHDCRRSTRLWTRYVQQSSLDRALLEPSFRLEEVRAVRSADEPACQVAHLFAVLGAFSRAMAQPFSHWRSRTGAPEAGFQDSPLVELMSADTQRFQVLDEFGKRCRAMRLGVSLQSGSHLVTRNPQRPINFSHFSPDSESERIFTA
jgi:hypothetical protein